MKPLPHPATGRLQSGGLWADNGENRSLLLVLTGNTRLAVRHEISSIQYLSQAKRSVRFNKG